MRHPNEIYCPQYFAGSTLMTVALVTDLARVQTPPDVCSYLADERSSFDYRVCADLDAANFGELLRRGWRRFGFNIFRPICRSCAKCRPLRVVVSEFSPSKSQRRTMRRNEHIDVTIGPPSVTLDHIRLYDAFHLDMAERRGWREKTITPAEYYENFIGMRYEFARELLYWDGDRLMGVGLIDVTPAGLSSAYFFHDPEWRDLGPGTFSALTELRLAAQLKLPHLYLGYWIAQNQSMAYKARYQPHELLSGFVDDDVEPDWRLAVPIEGADAD